MHQWLNLSHKQILVQRVKFRPCLANSTSCGLRTWKHFQKRVLWSGPQTCFNRILLFLFSLNFLRFSPGIQTHSAYIFPLDYLRANQAFISAPCLFYMPSSRINPCLRLLKELKQWFTRKSLHSLYYIIRNIEAYFKIFFVVQ